MTQPLRDMAAAARRMETGDYSVRVHTKSRDEVGKLAVAFDRMRGELEHLEQSRRDLVANVSHELKTPITAIRAHLENLLDGVEQPEPATLGVMLVAGRAARASRRSAAGALAARVRRGAAPDRGAAAPAAGGRPDLRDRRRGAGPRRRRSATPSPLGSARPSRPTASACTRSCSTSSTTRFGSPRTGAASPCPLVAGTVPSRWRSPTRAPASRPSTCRGSSSASTVPTPRAGRGEGGTGIGLAIARSVVEAHGGQITAESQPGHGSIFTFDLPAAAEASDR